MTVFLIISNTPLWVFTLFGSQLRWGNIFKHSFMIMYGPLISLPVFFMRFVCGGSILQIPIFFYLTPFQNNWRCQILLQTIYKLALLIAQENTDLLNINHRKIKIKHYMDCQGQQNFHLLIYFSFSTSSSSLLVDFPPIMIFDPSRNPYPLFNSICLFLTTHFLIYSPFSQPPPLIFSPFPLVQAYQLFNLLFKFILFNLSLPGQENLEAMLLLQFFSEHRFQRHIQLSFFLHPNYIAFLFGNLFDHYKSVWILFLGSLFILDHRTLYCLYISSCIFSRSFDFIWSNFLIHFYLSIQISVIVLFGTTLSQYIWKQPMFLSKHSSLYLKN